MKGKIMDFDELIETIKELKKKSGIEPDSKICCERLGPHIAILQRGWVVVGNLTKTGQEYRLDQAYVVRNWGTTKGLGEIAENGPTDKTVLDSSPTIRFHELTVVAFMECNKKKWDKKLD